ncbi:MAG: hypothetical protein GXY03_13410 [Solirubrobacterales bacterium]|nr:hypothetical protein [Solirubrobacterales bacterium]
MEDRQPPQAAHVTGDGALATALRERGLAGGEPEDALVLDAAAADPSSWAELEAELLAAYRLSQRAVAAGAPVVYVVDGAAVYGHAAPLRAALATGLLGGARSLAAEGRRDGVPAHAVTADPSAPVAPVADTVAWLLAGGAATGQLVHCDDVHVGRPAA